MVKKVTNKKAHGGSNRPKPMTPKAGVTVKRRRYGCGGKLK
jgi:hypothetical protein